MKEQTPKAVHRRRTRSEMESLLREYDKSKGLSIKEFCRRHHMAEGTFYHYRKLFGAKTSNAGSRGFIAIGSSGSAGQPAERLFAEFRGIRIYQPVTAEYLKSLCI